jgi:hypothetical protein
VLVTVLLVLAAARGDPAVLRVSAGTAEVVEAGRVHALAPRSGAREVAGAAWLECGPRSTLDVAWRGLASARITGPATLALGPGRALAVERYEVLELEVRRGGLALELPELGGFELPAGVLRVRALPAGIQELTNRGGAVLELARPGGDSITLAPGARVRLRAGA